MSSSSPSNIPEVVSSVVGSVKETDISDTEVLLLPKYKEAIRERVEEYLTTGLIKSMKLPKIAHFRTIWNESYRFDPARPDNALPFNVDGAHKVAAEDTRDLPGPPPELSSWHWVQTGMAPDRLYIRFLRARQHDIPAATFMFIQYIHWLHAFGVSELIRIRPMPLVDRMDNALDHTFHGHDKSGRPIYIQRCGLIDPPYFCNILTPQQAQVAHTWSMSQYAAAMERESRKRGYRVDRMCLILDLKGLSLSQRSLLSFFRATSYIDQCYFPEFLGASYFINAPKIFAVFWTIIKRFLHPVTQSKFKVLSSDYRSTLLADLGEDHVPKEYGGTCVCYKDTGNCIRKRTDIDLTGINQRQGKLGLADGISEEEASIIKPLQDIADEKWKTIHVKAGSKEIIEIALKALPPGASGAGRISPRQSAAVPHRVSAAADPLSAHFPTNPKSSRANGVPALVVPLSEEKSGASPPASPATGVPLTPSSLSSSAISAVWWYIQCTAKDIDFAADFLPSGDAKEEDVEPIVEKKRLHAPAAAEKNVAAAFVRGVFILPEENEQGGKVRLTLDNTYSRFTGKTVKIAYDSVERPVHFTNGESSNV